MSLILPPPLILPTAFISGNWYYPAENISLAAGSVIAANVIRLIPFPIHAPVTLNSLGIRVTTTAAGGLAQLGLYANNPVTGRPTGTALASTASMSTTTGAAVPGALGANTSFGAALYWLGINNDATAGGTAIYQTVSSGVPWMSAFIGSATQATIANGSTAAAMNLSTAQTFGTWPDLTSATFAENTGTASAMAHFKVA